MRRYLLVAFVLVFAIFPFVFLTSGCSKLDSGIIIEKKHTPRYVAPVITRVNGITLVRNHVYEESYDFKLKGFHKNKVKIEWCSVGEKVYNSYHVNDHYNKKGEGK